MRINSAAAAAKKKMLMTDRLNSDFYLPSENERAAERTIGESGIYSLDSGF